MIAKAVIFLLFTSASAEDAEGVTPGLAGGQQWVQKLHKHSSPPGTCGDLKAAYKEYQCCGQPSTQTHLQLIPLGDRELQKYGPAHNENPCAGKKPAPGTAFDNKPCTINGTLDALEQAGANVTQGYEGDIDATGGGRSPITIPLFRAGLCPVNVHWHLGAEHLSVGQFDDQGTGPDDHLVLEDDHEGGARRLAAEARLGFRCHHYDKSNPKFTTEYKWHHCTDMQVGETYEIHWPHSAAGACGTPSQYQTPFYDGVFCNSAAVNEVLAGNINMWDAVGVQSQTFTIINDEAYYYPDLFRGMIVDADMGKDMAFYTGSTTGTSRNNEMCSAYTPITWQVDRKCHLISASSFDKMCADMQAQRDDMSGDIYPHGSRIVVADFIAANNQEEGSHVDTR